MPRDRQGPGPEVAVNKKMLFRGALVSLGLATTLLFAPAARAQESCPDHFTETGVELGCPSPTVAKHSAPVAESKQAKHAKPVVASAAPASSTAAPAHNSQPAADKNRTIVAVVPKQ